MQDDEYSHAVQVVLRETDKVAMRQQEKRIPDFHMQSAHTICLQKAIYLRYVASFKQQLATSMDNLNRLGHRTDRCDNIQIPKVIISAKTLWTAGHAEQLPHFLQIYTSKT